VSVKYSNTSQQHSDIVQVISAMISTKQGVQEMTCTISECCWDQWCVAVF